MNTSSLITFISRPYPDWSRAAILDFISDVQELILAVPTEYMRYKNPINGGSYPLITTAGKLSYTLSAVSTPFSSPNASLSLPAISFVGKISKTDRTAKEYNRISMVNTVVGYSNDGDSSNPAVVHLSVDPTTTSYGNGIPTGTTLNGVAGTMTASHYLDAYKTPTALLSEASLLSIPAQYHLDLASGVKAMIESFMSHGDRRVWEEFVNNTIPKIRYGLSNQSHTATFVKASF